MFRQVVTPVRALSVSAARSKQSELIADLFVKQIRELGAKQTAAGGLVNTSPELKKNLEEQLNRLANKFRLASTEVVAKLDVSFEQPKVESSVSAGLESQSVADLIAQVKKEETEYLAQREQKLQAERQRQAILGNN